MITTYQLNANELSVDLINSIKAAFTNKVIEITVSEASDETGYLLASEANKKSLSASSALLQEGNGIVFTVEELQKKYGGE